MTKNKISLLPENERQKEEEVKEEVKENMPLPDFEIHFPEKKEKEEVKGEKNKKDSWVKVEESNTGELKGDFEIVNKKGDKKQGFLKRILSKLRNNKK